MRSDICSKRRGVGGEAATVTRTGVGRGDEEGEAQRRVSTVGAALKCVMDWVVRRVQRRG